MSAQVRAGAARCSIAAVLFGASTPFAAQLAGETSAPLLAGLLYAGAALAVVPSVVRGDTAWSDLRASWRPLAGAVVFGGLLGPLLLVIGLSHTTAATASLLLNLEMVATTLLAAWLFHEHIGRRTATGTVLVMASGCVLGWSGNPDARLGALLIVAACVCWGIDNCVTASLDQVSPASVTLVKGVVAGSTNVAIGLVIGGSFPAAGTTTAALVIGMLGYGISITVWVAGARDLGAARGQLVLSAAPFIGVLVAWVVFGDPLTTAEVIAVVVAGAGVLCVIGSGHEHDHSHEPIDHTHEHRHDDGHHLHDHHGLDPARPHTHRHEHRELVHAHPHVPDLHHRHDH